MERFDWSPGHVGDLALTQCFCTAVSVGFCVEMFVCGWLWCDLIGLQYLLFDMNFIC